MTYHALLSRTPSKAYKVDLFLNDKPVVTYVAGSEFGGMQILRKAGLKLKVAGWRSYKELWPLAPGVVKKVEILEPQIWFWQEL